MTMRINTRLLPIKAHFFFFMAAMGPILPQLPVYGKELGISSEVMGTVTGILPILFLLAKPLFGMIVDVYRDYRKTIFMLLIVVMTASYALLNFIPARSTVEISLEVKEGDTLDTCNVRVLEESKKCRHSNSTVKVICGSNCTSDLLTFVHHKSSNNTNQIRNLCSLNNETYSFNCTSQLRCLEDLESNTSCLYKSFTFWGFVICMFIGTIGFNVINSISDAICFDVIGEEHDYGKQRVWGTIGFGVTALLSGYVVNLFSGSAISYTPAFIVMTIFSIFDLIACMKLKLPIIEAPKNIFKDISNLLNNRHVVTFISFAVLAGVVDSLIIYYLFWYIEDLAIQTNTTDIKLIEGLIVAAETLGGEVIFFSVSGKILDRIGHINCFSLCFINYALRLSLVSIAPSPWWILPIEFVFQGPTYALTYTTIVAYANELSPPGTSATMQGIAAGMDDGVGFAIGSILGGFLYKFLGGTTTFQIFSLIAVFSGIAHLILHKTILRKHAPPDVNKNVEYKSPDEAAKTVYEIVE